MSSTMASVRRKGRRVAGARRAATVSTPRAKAMSVAIGIPHPRAPSPPTFTRRYRPAGTTIPPTAASTGRAAARGSRSSPIVNSRLISRPTTRKNRVISPSFTAPRRSSWIA
jgi:hypothetical protein